MSTWTVETRKVESVACALTILLQVAIGRVGTTLDNMADWDEAKLNEVVETKHGEADKNKPKTTIVTVFWNSKSFVLLTK